MTPDAQTPDPLADGEAERLLALEVELIRRAPESQIEPTLDRVRAVLGESMTVPGSGAAARSADVILDLIRESRTGAAD